MPARRNTYVPQEFDDSITHKIYSITSYIHSNYAQELSLDYISKKFFISPYYLSHQFKSVTGFTLINYIQMTRVRNAQQLLLYTDMKNRRHHGALRLHQLFPVQPRVQ